MPLAIRDRIALLMGGNDSGPSKTESVASGKVVRAGLATKLAGMGASHKRWCVVTDDPMLTTYADESKSTVKGTVNLAGATFSSADAIFQILPQGKTAALKFKAASADEAALWVAALHEACGGAPPPQPTTKAAAPPPTNLTPAAPVAAAPAPAAVVSPPAGVAPLTAPQTEPAKLPPPASAPAASGADPKAAAWIRELSGPAARLKALATNAAPLPGCGDGSIEQLELLVSRLGWQGWAGREQGRNRGGVLWGGLMVGRRLAG